MEEVEAALMPEEGEGIAAGPDGDGYEAPTTREVLRFIKNNAPQEWREPRRITGAENALVKVTPSPRAFFLFRRGSTFMPVQSKVRTAKFTIRSAMPFLNRFALYP